MEKNSLKKLTKKSVEFQTAVASILNPRNLQKAD